MVAGDTIIKLSEELLQAVIWLGDDSILLDAAWSASTVYHVRDEHAVLRALETQVAEVLVIDLIWLTVDPAPFLGDIRQRWPAVGILALVDVPAGTPLSGDLFAGIDAYLSRNASVVEWEAIMDKLSDQVAQRLREAQQIIEATDESPNAELRHLEGLVQASFAIAHVVDEGDILGNLRDVARVAVDADDLVVLLTDEQFSDLFDGLKLGVPPAYLDVCREHLLMHPPSERLLYMGDEVLLRERLPDMLPTAIRVREAASVDAWSYMRLPLMLEQNLIGFVALFSSTPGQFDGAHVQLGRLFASQVSIAVRNMRLYMRLNRAEQRQRAVSEVARLITEDLSLDTVLCSIAQEAVRLVNGHVGAVLLAQPDGSFVVSATYNQGAMTQGERIPAGVGQVGQVARTRQPSVVTDYRQWPHANENFRPHFPEDGVLFGLPLIYRGDVLGVLQVVTHNRALNDIHDHLDTLVMLAPHVAIAIAKAQLHERVEQDRQQLLAILQHTAAAVAVCDADGYVLMVNPGAERVLELLGLGLEDVQQRAIPDLLAGWLPEEPIDLPRAGGMVEVNLGEAGEYLLHIAPITRSDGTIDRYVGVAQEVSELRRADRLKSDMIHILSHDLRNPLGLARGSIDLIDEPDLDPDQRAQLKDMIINSLVRMDQLIQEVLDLEQAESAGVHTALPYRLPAVVKGAVERNQEHAQDNQITLFYNELQAPPHDLQGHAVLVSQAIDNLIGNAIKYTPSGGHIEVTLGVEDGYAVVRVADNGYGIPEDSLPLLFKKFYRVKDKRTRHVHGTGLGLSLVKAAIDAHGGTVIVDSRVDVGSVFSIYLPLIPPMHTKTTNAIPRLDLSALVQGEE